MWRILPIRFGTFYVDSGEDLILIPFVEDDSTAIPALTTNTWRFSYLPDDFSSPIATVVGTYLDFGGGNEFWYADIPVAGMLMNTIIYMRYYVNDGDNPEVEWPNTQSDPLYYSYMSFIIR